MAINPTNHPSYQFAEFRIDSAERVLLRDGDLVPLTAKVFDLLLMLVENHGHVVEKERLMREIWPDTFVEEGNLTQNISVLRKTLGEKQYIQTIPRRGYRFVGNVQVIRGSLAELVIEEHSRSRIIVDERQDGFDSPALPPAAVTALTSAPKRTVWTQRNIFSASAGLCILVAAGLVWNFWRRPEPPAPRNQIKTIAVLPFKPLSNEGREEYLELGNSRFTDHQIEQYQADISSFHQFRTKIRWY